MILYNVYRRLWSIDQEAQKLISESGFDSDEGFGPQVCFDRSDPDACFLSDRAWCLLESFEKLHEELEYICTPVTGEYQLHRLMDGRYGYRDEFGHDHSLSPGTPFEAKIPVGEGCQRWVCTRIERDEDGYFLWCYGDVPLSGLTIRQRGCILP